MKVINTFFTFYQNKIDLCDYIDQEILRNNNMRIVEKYLDITYYVFLSCNNSSFLFILIIYLNNRIKKKQNIKYTCKIMDFIWLFCFMVILKDIQQQRCCSKFGSTEFWFRVMPGIVRYWHCFYGPLVKSSDVSMFQSERLIVKVTPKELHLTFQTYPTSMI